MTAHLKSLLLAGVLTAGVGTLALAQSASTVGSAAAGGTSASTLGTGGTSTGSSGTSSTIGSAGSAAGGTSDRSSTHINGNDNNLHGMSKARAQDKGTWSDSKTRTKVHKGEVSSTTKSMSHEPGGPPVKSTTGVSSGQ